MDDAYVSNKHLLRQARPRRHERRAKVTERIKRGSRGSEPKEGGGGGEH